MGDNLLKDIFTLGGKVIQGKRDAKAMEKNRKANLALVNSLDYEPMYASEVVPPMQRTQSPVARGYLESMLMGNNPDSTMSTRPNAAVTKTTQQRQQNAMFGTPQQRIAQQRALEQKPFYEVKTPTRPVRPADGKGQFAAENPHLAAMGIDKDIKAAYEKAGVEFQSDGRPRYYYDDFDMRGAAEAMRTGKLTKQQVIDDIQKKKGR